MKEKRARGNPAASTSQSALALAVTILFFNKVQIEQRLKRFFLSLPHCLYKFSRQIVFALPKRVASCDDIRTALRCVSFGRYVFALARNLLLLLLLLLRLLLLLLLLLLLILGRCAVKKKR